MPTQLRLRLIALVSAAVVLLCEAVRSLPLQLRQEAGFVVLVVAAAAVAVTLRFLLPGTTGRLRRHPDLLVPLGLVVLGEDVLGWLARVPAIAAILTPSWKLQLGVVSLAVSLAFVLGILLWAAYGAWMTVLLLQLVREDRDDPAVALPGTRRWFGRVLGLEVLG